MKQRVPVATIMTKNVVKLNVTDDLTKAEGLFKKPLIEKEFCLIKMVSCFLNLFNEYWSHIAKISSLLLSEAGTVPFSSNLY